MHTFAINLTLITSKLWIIILIKHELDIWNILLYLSASQRAERWICFTQANYHPKKMSFVWNLPPECGLVLSLVPSRCSGSEALLCGYCLANIPHSLHRSALPVSFPRTNCELSVCLQQYGVSQSLCPRPHRTTEILQLVLDFFSKRLQTCAQWLLFFQSLSFQPGCGHIISCLWKVPLHKVHM